MIHRLNRFRKWLLHKTPELRHLSLSDALLAKIVLDITRKATLRTFTSVPIHSIILIHPINRKSALDKIDLRVKALSDIKDTMVLNDETISNDQLIEIMPSVSPIQIIPYKDGYMSFEGNGRLMALQKIFSDTSTKLDVELFSLPSDSYIYKDIEKLQKMYSV
ncbi:MAG: hypothetical protein V4519_02060 [Patescibacteria group bacterium]